MKKYFICSDVHSFYDEWMESLAKKEFDVNNPDHIIIHCGDLFDRGPKSKECLEFIINLIKQDRAICIRGNHEDLMEEIFVRKYFKGHDIHNGADKTFNQLTTLDTDKAVDWAVIDDVMENKDLQLYLSSCKDYYELGDNIFVHGWIPCSYSYLEDGIYDELPPLYKPTAPKYDPNWREADFEDARWQNGMLMWAKQIREPGKTIWCGHWHASYGNAYIHNDGVEHLQFLETYHLDPDTGNWEPHVNYNTFIDDGIRALDACTVVSHFVNVEIIEC